MTSILEKKCIERGLRMTEQRRIIAQVLSEATDHPDAEEVEFVDAEIEALQEKIAEKLGYELVDHRMELYGRKKKT